MRNFASSVPVSFSSSFKSMVRTISTGRLFFGFLIL